MGLLVLHTPGADRIATVFATKLDLIVIAHCVSVVFGTRRCVREERAVRRTRTSSKMVILQRPQCMYMYSVDIANKQTNLKLENHLRFCDLPCCRIFSDDTCLSYILVSPIDTALVHSENA